MSSDDKPRVALEEQIEQLRQVSERMHHQAIKDRHRLRNALQGLLATLPTWDPGCDCARCKALIVAEEVLRG